MAQNTNISFGFRLAWLSALCVLLGQAWIHLGWDVPWRAVFWSEELMQPVLSLFQIESWDHYLAHVATDRRIRLFQYAMGGILAVTAGVVMPAIWNKYRPRKEVKPYWNTISITCYLSVTYMVLLALASWYTHFQYPIHFFEYVLRFISPVFFLWAFKQESLSPRQWNIIRLAIGVTFLSHGLYALNVFPSPASFKQMTAAITGLEGRGAALFLAIAGWLDVLIVIGLFLPRKYQSPIILYAVFWGLATSLARPLAFIYLNDLEMGLGQWIPQFLVRCPHFLVPLWLWSHLKSPTSNTFAN